MDSNDVTSIRRCQPICGAGHARGPTDYREPYEPICIGMTGTSMERKWNVFETGLEWLGAFLRTENFVSLHACSI